MRGLKPSTHQGTVVDHPTAADVDAMMGKPGTRCNEVRAQRWFLAFGEASIVRTKSAANPTFARRDSNIVLPPHRCARLREKLSTKLTD